MNIVHATCHHCGHPTRPGGTPAGDWPGTRLHNARGLCVNCYPQHRHQHDRQHRPAAELLAEVDQLEGTPEQVAARLGVSLAAIGKAARRQGRPHLARVYESAYKRTRYQPTRRAS